MIVSDIPEAVVIAVVDKRWAAWRDQDGRGFIPVWTSEAVAADYFATTPAGCQLAKLDGFGRREIQTSYLVTRLLKHRLADCLPVDLAAADGDVVQRTVRLADLGAERVVDLLDLPSVWPVLAQLFADEDFEPGYATRLAELAVAYPSLPPYEAVLLASRQLPKP